VVFHLYSSNSSNSHEAEVNEDIDVLSKAVKDMLLFAEKLS
jgi:hypothetical protein